MLPSHHRNITKMNSIYDILRKEIRLGIIPPGERLLEVPLAERFRINRHRIREVLKKLESDEMVNIVPFKGASVIQPSVNDLRANYEVQSALEGLACLLSVPTLTNNDIKRLTKLNRRMGKMVYGRIEEWQALNISFHRIFIQKSGNKKIGKIIRELLYFTRYWSLVLSIPGTRPKYTEDHRKIIEAVKKKDAGLARKYMEAHILRAASEIISTLEYLPRH